MNISIRIFLSFLAVVCLCLFFPLQRLADTINVHYREGVEDVLADQANILAAFVQDEMQQGGFSAARWREIFNDTHGRTVSALIYQLSKEHVDADVYITDVNGTVLFDSETPSNAGADFSQWRDVYLTLQGRYGARTSRLDTKGEPASRLHVAAPIYLDGSMAGVLTVVKPTTNIRYFEQGARKNIIRSGIFAFAAAGLLSLLVTYWLTRPIKRLTAYAKGIRDGQNPAFPRLDSSEIGELGTALAEMQETLEGRRYVEQYVEHLTHELKSPLSAIRGAAELLKEPMEDAQRQRFIRNIEGQSIRMQELVDRMLELAALESPGYQRSHDAVDVSALLHSVCAAKEPLMLARKLRHEVHAPEKLPVEADGFLLRQALSNMVQNALDFSPEGGRITVYAALENGTVCISVCDAGPGIPEFATERVFEKFFSLQRPDSGQKSTGLGLNFVRQVAQLHGGAATLSNRPEGGACAAFIFPAREG